MFCACAWSEGGKPPQSLSPCCGEMTESPLLNRALSPLAVSFAARSRRGHPFCDADQGAPRREERRSGDAAGRHGVEAGPDSPKEPALGAVQQAPRRWPRVRSTGVLEVVVPAPGSPVSPPSSSSSGSSSSIKDSDRPSASPGPRPSVDAADSQVDETASFSLDLIRQPDPSSPTKFMPIGPVGAAAPGGGTPAAAGRSQSVVPTTKIVPPIGLVGAAAAGGGSPTSAGRSNSILPTPRSERQGGSPVQLTPREVLVAASTGQLATLAGPPTGACSTQEHCDPETGARCTARDPFWSYAKEAARIHDPSSAAALASASNMLLANGGAPSLTPLNACLQDAVLAVDRECEIEVPDSELMTVQLWTREQRLDWRDFLCEAVAGRKAAVLFSKFDVDAEPPAYARPPPSVPRRWLRAAGPGCAVHCVAPHGAGWSPTLLTQQHHACAEPASSSFRATATSAANGIASSSHAGNEPGDDESRSATCSSGDCPPSWGDTGLVVERISRGGRGSKEEARAADAADDLSCGLQPAAIVAAASASSSSAHP